jgi:hypothetical protein
MAIGHVSEIPGHSYHSISGFRSFSIPAIREILENEERIPKNHGFVVHLNDMFTGRTAFGREIIRTRPPITEGKRGLRQVEEINKAMKRRFNPEGKKSPRIRRNKGPR